MNPLLDVPNLDPHRDTPIELLHTWLLGVVKYVWYILHSSWSEKQQNNFVIRLQDTNTDGLELPPIRAAYMMQYRNGLIGKHFKSLAQTMAGAIHGLATEDQRTLVRTMGELSPMLYMSEIDDMDTHPSDIKILIGNLHDVFANIDPARIIVKEKLQVLIHVVDDIKHFGPPPRVSSETFECFNGVFRLSSVHSNHQAPSHDIAVKMAGIECVRHIVTGGYWPDEHGKMICAGDNVLSTFRQSPLLQHHFGWTSQIPAAAPGDIRLPPQKKRVSVMAGATCATASRTPFPAAFRLDVCWERGVSVIAQSGDVCGVESWVVAKSAEGGDMIGQIQDLLTSSNGRTPGNNFVVLERYQLSSARHPYLGMPVLRPSTSGDSEDIVSAMVPHVSDAVVIPSTAVLFIINVQHDCETTECSLTSARAVRQERLETELRETAVKHDLARRRFVINLHAHHNAALIRRHLPRSLWAPQALYEDRKARHNELSTGLRVTQAAKRAETQRKRHETRQKNLQKSSGVAQTSGSATSIEARAGPEAAATASLLEPAALLRPFELDVEQGMSLMRGDSGVAATVCASALAIAPLQVLVYAMNGKSIKIDNTNIEGRLVLSIEFVSLVALAKIIDVHDQHTDAM
ncbi:hypothetical protein TRAPUB_10797 [Trametes pubescens]|uniref:Uncharacterized protein n=1 Tax=Trametes pubescens TaxID=154538 RepID=A0A1M2VYG9_TRAPU|nr:hypothetical protein TRAPUB_10797 [Trametes pubescens]